MSADQVSLPKARPNTRIWTVNEPYRSAEIVKVDAKKTRGLIPVFNFHRCKPPWLWCRWWLEVGTLWRCHCGAVWQVEYIYKLLHAGRTWEPSSLDQWTTRGGDE